MSAADGAWRDFVGHAAAGHDFVEEYLAEPAPVPTGTKPVDEVLGGGLYAGLNVVAGEPGSFKTGTCVWWFYEQAVAGRRPVYLSLEMPYRNVVMRMVSIATVRDRSLRTVRWGSARRMGYAPLDAANDRDAAYRAAMAYERDNRDADPVLVGYRAMLAEVGGRCAVVDQPWAHDLGKVCDAIGGLAEDGWVGPVYVDYMSLLEVGDGTLSDFDRMTRVSRELARVARTWRIPIVAIYSLKKLTAREREEGPSLSWLRGTGSIGYDAETATILAPCGEEDDRGVVPMRAHVVKNRHGECRDVDYAAQRWSGWVGEIG